MPTLPHPHLIALRLAATVLLSAVIGQAGWAAAMLGGESRYARFHEVGAWVTLTVAVLSALTYVLLRRSAGPVNLWLAVGLTVAIAVQISLGETGQRALHIFVGVLIAMLATALTSWTYRHKMPETDGTAGGPIEVRS
ncbi:hypothetical protein [Ornithinimicrobium pratense]|uniref:Uncharacterized protein n=1 Tax=Ornithinimicrobium pratense TaxID=2593973 RepID=A0A5J6V1E2_9MICO|nr:hypothetical protein [Ornithinimicrobium pratense]QFG67378.1 hypothetical protein FY030_00355 [Ornithinimicrobium pratense]